MSKTQIRQSISDGERGCLKTIFEEHRHIMLQILERRKFAMDDIEVPTHGGWRSMVKKLSALGSISVCGDRVRTHDEWGKDVIREWQWKPGAREYLESYADRSDALPCGHRPHIYHHEDGRFGCKFCDVEQNYSKDDVLAVMD